jgi:hypothetical protein
MGAVVDVASVVGTVDRITGRVGSVAVRWLAGLLWLSNLNWKKPPDFGAADGRCDGLCGFAALGVEHPVAPGAAQVFEHLVLENLSVFGWLTLGVELSLAAMLLSGRYVRSAAVIGAVQSLAIGLAVANAPGEWFWAYLLMFGLHVAVLVQAGDTRPAGARTMGLVTIGYGVVVAVAHAQAGFSGEGATRWTLFSGADGEVRDIPDEFGRNVFTGSLALGGLLVVLGLGVVACGRLTANARRVAGWAMVGVAAAMALTARVDGTAVGLGSSAATAAMVAAAGLALAAGAEPSSDQPEVVGAAAASKSARAEA